MRKLFIEGIVIFISILASLSVDNMRELNDEQEVLSEKILDDLFYPEFDKLKGIEETAGDLPVLEIPEDLEEDTSEIKSLNFR